MPKIDLSQYRNALSRKHQIVRLIWEFVWGVGASWIPRSMGSWCKRTLLRMFGAKIHSTAVVYSSPRVVYPANLRTERHLCLA